jgi:hypothetical protein
MPQPLRRQISLSDTFITMMCPAEHIVLLIWYASRALDSYSDQSYEHRRGWVEERLLFLSSVIAIDNAANVFVLMR